MTTWVIWPSVISFKVVLENVHENVSYSEHFVHL